MKIQKLASLLIVSIIGSCINLSASPAYPGLINFVQPDGSKISIYLKGDERVKWAETEDGYSVLFNVNGAYEYAVLNSQGDMVPSGRIAKNAAQRSPDDLSFLFNVPKQLIYSSSQMGMAKQIGNMMLKDGKLLKSFPTTGDRKLLCILIGFADKPFTKTQLDFDNLFNQAVYTVNGATGSVSKFFKESSYNQLNLSVTVAGPYTALNTVAYYGGNDSSGDDLRPRELVTEAVNLADPYVNYADFDNDLDGAVDGVYVIYAGYGEESGGSPNYIWAHAWSIPTVTHDGKTISRYSCSPELAGSSGSYITNIGVICHEYGHILGASDFYDTNYATDGQYPGTGNWDLQSNGSWNNSGKTPAQPNAYTKCYVYNWATATNITTLSSPITIQNSSVQNTGSFFRMNSATNNEYFLFENRQQVGFDASLPGHGMLVYHVDGDYIASHSGSINSGSHQGMYIVSANSIKGNGVTISAQSLINTNGCTFPGTLPNYTFTDASTPHSNSWAGANTKIPITNIAENSGIITFNYNANICSPPATQASGISITDVTSTSMTVSWIRGNGNKVLVVARASENDNTNPQDGYSYKYPSTEFASVVYSKIGNNNYVVYNGIGTSVNITGLRSGIDYYYSIYEYNISDNCYKTPALTSHAVTLGGLCSSSGNTTYQTSITRVIFNTIDQASAKPSGSGYSDFTTVPTSVVKNSDYQLTVNLNTDGNYAIAAYAWIDWNHNNSFDDVGEGYDLGKVYSNLDGKTSKSPLKITIPSTAIDGISRMRISCKYYIAPSACETGFDGEVEDYTLNIITPVETTWIGTTSAWNTGTNWSSGDVPQFNYNVTIPDVPPGKFDPIINTVAASNNLTIQSGGVLNIGTAGTLTIYNNLTNNADVTGLVLQSAEGGTGSLKIMGSVSGSANVKRYMSYSHWHIISPPATESLSTFLTRNLDIPFLSTSTSKLGMTDYGTVNWNDYFTTSTIGDLAVGKGYLVRTATDASFSATILNFLGPLKSGTTTVSTTTGWNCIGNPFTTAIGVNGGVGETSNFMGLNLSKFDPNNACIYVWDETYSITQYKVINYADTKLYASVGQGFFIKAANESTVSFNPDMQVHQGSIALKAVSTDIPEIRLTVANKNHVVSTSIKFVEGTTQGLDIGYDAGLFKSNDTLSIFTKLVEDNGVQFQLQCLPTNQYNSLVIPVGIESKYGGEIVFTVQTVQLDPNCKVILEDRLTSIFTDLSKESYKAEIAANSSVSDRFFLHTADIVSGLEDQEIYSGKLTAFSVGNVEIRVIGEVGKDALATLYDTSGRIVLFKTLGGGSLNIIGLPSLKSGLYLLKIKDAGKAQTIKVMVRK